MRTIRISGRTLSGSLAPFTRRTMSGCGRSAQWMCCWDRPSLRRNPTSMGIPEAYGWPPRWQPDGTMKTFDAPNAVSTLPQSINDDDLVTGWFVVGGNSYHGVVRAP